MIATILRVIAAFNAVYQVTLSIILIIRIEDLQDAGNPAYGSIYKLNNCILWLVGSIVLSIIARIIDPEKTDK